jgi:hypothetical protein
MPDRGMGDVYWFADVDDAQVRRAAAPWQVFLQTPYGCYPLAGIWFDTKSDCEAFIGDIVTKAADHA